MKRAKRREPESYRERRYRALPDREGLVASSVKIKDTDLHILADRDVSGKARGLALRYRLQIEQYIKEHQLFVHSLLPLPFDPLAPPVVREMLKAGNVAGVGPMAAVAGAIAEAVGRDLVQEGCLELMVENGGDIYLQRRRDCTVAIFAGESPLSLQVGVRLAKEKMPMAVCTSSGTVGHSLSFGLADSVTVLAGSTPVADAAATSIGNEIGRVGKRDGGIKKALEMSREIPGLYGVVAICGDKIGAVGDVELVRID